MPRCARRYRAGSVNHDLPRKDYYGVLKLPPGSSEGLIRQRYKRLAKRFHPDVNPAPDAAARFREIKEAHDVLLDPARKAVVDSWFVPRVRRAARRAPTQRAGVPTVPPAQKRPISPVWTTGSDRVWSFGCFGIAAFVLAFFGAVSQPASVQTALVVAVGVAVVVGSIAALGGERIHESLLWVLRALWWW